MLSEWPLYAIGVFGAVSIWLGFRIGQYNLATVVYMAAGGYTAAALAALDIALPWYLIIALAVIVASAFGVLTGLVALRVHGFTYALLTMAMVEIMLATIVLVDVLGAARGLVDPDLTDDRVLIAAGVLGLVLVVAVVIVDFFRFGLRLRTFELGPERFASLGNSPWRFSVAVNILMAVIASLAGLITYKYTHYIQPSQFDLTMEIELLAFVIVGGVAGPLGPVVVAVLLTFLGQELDAVGDWRDIIMAAILLTFMVVRAQGLVGDLRVRIRMSAGRYLTRGETRS